MKSVNNSFGNLIKPCMTMLAVLSLSLFCSAALIEVPGDYLTIQEAINAADTGDEIVVSPATYTENISFANEDIILRSTNPTDPSVVAATVIDGGGSGRVVTFGGSETSACVLSGFTITNGSADIAAGIYGNFSPRSQATVQYNVITGNTAPNPSPNGYGGGIAYFDGLIQYNTISDNFAKYGGGGLCFCFGTVQNNIISGNTAEAYGGGLYECYGTVQNNHITQNLAFLQGGGLRYCDGVIQNNLIYKNSTFYSVSQGGGLRECDGVIRNNTIWANSTGASGDGGGMSICNATIINNIVWANFSGTDPQIFAGSTPSYSCIQGWTGGGTGNITNDPQLVDPANANFHIPDTSPCVDAGGAVSLSQDFEGDARPFNGTSDPRGDGSDYDIGADEYVVSVNLGVISEYDTPVPSVGIHSYTSGTMINAYMTDPFLTDTDTKYTCVGWLGQGAVPDSGSTHSLSFVLDQPSTITWQWETEYYLTATANPPAGGSVTLIDGTTPASGWYVENDAVQVLAVPASGYQFDNWSGDLSGSTNPETVTMSSPKSITANFSVAGTPTPVPTPILSFDFDPGPEGWTFRQIPPGPLHISHWDHATSVMVPSAIGINTPYDESTNFFALWDSLDTETAPYTADSLYQVDWLFSTNRGTTNAVPSLRFRVGLTNQKAFAYSRVYPGDWLPLAQTPGMTTYTLFFEPPVEADALFLAFSLIDWSNDFRGSQPAGDVYLEEVNVYRHELASLTGWQTETTSFDLNACTTAGAPPYTAPAHMRTTDSIAMESGIGAADVFGTWDTPADLFSLGPDKLYRLNVHLASDPQLGGPDLRLRVHTDDFRYAWYSYYVSSYTAGESALPPEEGGDMPLYLLLPFGTKPCHLSFDLVDFSSGFGGALVLHNCELESLDF